MEINQDKIESAIVADAVREIVKDDSLYERVTKGVDARIDALFATRVEAFATEAVDKIIKGGFEREYTKRDGFGRPVGEPTSISKEMERLISQYWEQRVNSAGKPVENGSYGSTSRAEWMMTQICADDFSKQMKQHVVNVGGALKDHFRAVLNQHVALMLSEVFNVQSEGDRDRGKPGRSSIDPPAKPIGAPAA